MRAAVLLACAALAGAFDVSLFKTPCKTNSDCPTNACDTSGPHANGDPDYYYCMEPDECDMNAPQRVDGVCNNMNPGRRLRGSAGHMQLRRINGTFSHGVGPRTISDGVGASPGSIPNKFGTSLLMVYFGQFVDHDFTIVHESEEVTMTVTGSGAVSDMTFHQSLKIGGPSNQPNMQNHITSWLDLTQVYGSDAEMEDALRKHTGGEMQQQWIHGKEYLPYNADMANPMPMAMDKLPGIFAAGDIRANEHVMLLSWHTLFLREHNRLARQFASENPSFTDEALYQKARRWNIAQYQNIVFEEFFPGWCGESLPDYSGYDEEETPDIDILFSTAAFRFGHSAISSIVARKDDTGADHSMPLNEVFFNPTRVLEDGGIDSLLKGASEHCHERVDPRVVDELRDALFEDIPGNNDSVPLDLLSLNIARGRDHQLPKYTDARAYFGLSVPTSFDEVTGGESCLTMRLEELYGEDNVEQCDPIICGLAEPASHGHMGDLFFNVIADQLRRMRDADRFYFENGAPGGPGLTGYLDEIKKTRLHHILRRNTFMHDHSDDPENYVKDAFKTDSCCASEGNEVDDLVCLADGLMGGSEWGTADHCTAMGALWNEPVHLAGTGGFGCDCKMKTGTGFDANKFRTPCKTGADCVTGFCETSGPNVNGDPAYFYCSEPNDCDASAPQRVDGVCNNLNPGRRLRGSAGHMQLRRINGTFSSDVEPRKVSDGIGASPGSIPNKFGTSLLMVYFGQFIDHDFTIVHENEHDTITVAGSGVVQDITFHQSLKIGGSSYQPNMQNFITSWLDLTQVYGSHATMEEALRKHTGGEMLQQWIHGKEYLPYNVDMTTPMPMAMDQLPGIFAAGDIRANEHLMLLSWHTLFLREHNRLARMFAADDPSLTDDELYHKARRWNIAQYQNIVFEEFLPGFCGETLPAYSGYDDMETPDIDILFSTAAFRFGHSAISNIVARKDALGNDYSMALKDAFFNPTRVLEHGGIDSLLKGASKHCHERVDPRVVDELRNSLFEDIPGTNGSMALDLLTLNIARGRDHQLPKYTDARAYFGLWVPTTFDEVTGGESCLTERLEALYGVDNVHQCDPIICGLAEPASHGHMGDLFFNVLADQFRRMRDADRFYFENQDSVGPGFSESDIQKLKETRLHHILRRNTFMTDDDSDSENYVKDAFMTDSCCQSGGNALEDTVCSASFGGSIWATTDHCAAMDAMWNHPDLHMAGTGDFGCDCKLTGSYPPPPPGPGGFDPTPFKTPCKVDADCPTNMCDKSGPNANGDPMYFYCAEPSFCDASAPQRVDGVCNNLNPGRRLRGSAGHMQLRRINGTFSNGVGPRNISDGIGASPGSIPNKFGTSLLLVYLGQFIDHDFTIVHENEHDTITVAGSGVVQDFTFHQSLKIGGASNQPNMQNFITSWLDLTQVYGSDASMEDALRKHTGGEMLQQWIHGKEYLPYNADMTTPMPMAMDQLPGIFAAGDIRANEHLMLLSFHTLFLREHNRLARKFAAEDPSLTDTELYQKARRWNIAQYQSIVLEEFFPSWCGESLPAYSGYNDEESPDIDILFSTAAFRFGHSAVSSIVARKDDTGADHSMPLDEVFFNPTRVLEDGGIDSLLKGASKHCHERVDPRVVNELRNALFEDIPGTNGSMGLDLLTLNIARGRDHQLPKYTDARAYFGLPVPMTFDEVTGGESCLTERLEALYGVDNVHQCDPIICGLAEPASHGHMGDLFFNLIGDQFRRMRDADRFYFENQDNDGPSFTVPEIEKIKSTKFHHILRRNTFMTSDKTDSENYIKHAFQTDSCCQSAGNDVLDTICVADGLNGGVEWGMVDHCNAMDALWSEPVHMAGTEDYDCSCNFVPPVACPYAEDGNLEVLLPPLLDEFNTHVTFDPLSSSSAFEATIKVPKQYRTAKFGFHGAVGNFGGFDSALDNNTYWTADKTSDPCNVIFKSMIPWNALRAALSGMNEQKYLSAVCYNLKINVEVTKELTVSPHAMLLEDHYDEEFTRFVKVVIPFEVCFKNQLKLWGTADVVSDNLRVASAVVDTSVLTVTPDASPLATAHVEFVTVIPLPLFLDHVDIATSNPLLAPNLSVKEIRAKRDCDPEGGFCTQFWGVHVEPEQCTLNGDFTATVRGACHSNANCIAPSPEYDDIVMHIASDDFCGITQEVEVAGHLTVQSTECNGLMHGTVKVRNTEGYPISYTEIVELTVAPTLKNSEFLIVKDASRSLLNYSSLAVARDQVDFQFRWLGKELRCDVMASVDVVVKVEYQATAGTLLAVKSSAASSSDVGLLSEDQDMRMSAEVQIFQDQTATAPPDSGNGDGNGQIAQVGANSRKPVLFSLTLLQVVLAGASIVLVVVLCACCGFYLCRPGKKAQVYRPTANVDTDEEQQSPAPVSQPL